MKENSLSGMVLDEETVVSLAELAQACSGSREWVIELVQEGILEPLDEREQQWRFTGISLVRARSARRLQQDLQLNLAGVALALELLDELSELRSRVKLLESQDW